MAPPVPSDSLKKSAKPPAPLSLEANLAVNWKRFKKRWENYELLVDLPKEDRKFQVAQLENCLSDDALTTLDGFHFETNVDVRTVGEIIAAFEKYAVGETNETLERFHFGKRSQEEGESFDKFLSDLRILMKTCGYCATCSPGILRDRIVLGLLSDDTREQLLKERKLTLDTSVDICKAMESATVHSKSLKSTSKSESVNKLEIKKTDEPRDCRFCPSKHPMVKELCPAWGKKCGNCGKKNDHASKCFTHKSASASASSTSTYHPSKAPRPQRGDLNG